MITSERKLIVTLVGIYYIFIYSVYEGCTWGCRCMCTSVHMRETLKIYQPSISEIGLSLAWRSHKCVPACLTFSHVFWTRALTEPPPKPSIHQLMELTPYLSSALLIKLGYRRFLFSLLSSLLFYFEHNCYFPIKYFNHYL